MTCLPAGIGDAEFASLSADAEATMISKATWLVYSETTEDGYGGRVEGWLATPDPLTGQPTIPCKITQSQPSLAVASAQSLDPIDIYYRGAVPLRIGLNVRDRLVVAGVTYEVVDIDAPPTLLMQARFGCRVIR